MINTASSSQSWLTSSRDFPVLWQVSYFLSSDTYCPGLELQRDSEDDRTDLVEGYGGPRLKSADDGTEVFILQKTKAWLSRETKH